MGIFSRKRRRRVHLCTITPDQQPYYDAVARWLRQQGHRVLVEQSASLTDKLAAARACDLCVLLLGPTYGPREPQLSFSATELEAYAALEGQANKLLTFAQTDAETASAFEQQEFIARLRDFSGGSFQATADSPEQFVAQVC